MRAPFGTDRLESGPDGTLTIFCAAPKGWRPRTPAISRRAEHPGTAVAWGEDVFEVVQVESLPDGETRYSLAPWREDFAIRSLERYDAASEEAREAERRWRKNARRKRLLAIGLSPVLGHLPGTVQESMEREFGAPANLMTVASALPLFVLGVVGLLAGVARIAGGSLAPLPEPSLPLSIYLVLESSLRISLVVTQSRPAGSIPGTVGYEIWKLVRSYNLRGGPK